MKKILIGLIICSLFTAGYTQNLYIPRDIKKAIDNGSRSLDGNPGEGYFQNRADYTIEAEIDPNTRILKGNETIQYQNNSDFTIRYVVVRLNQNVFKKGSIRGRALDPEDTNDGVKITSLEIDGKTYDLENDHWLLHESFTNIYLPFECSPNSGATITIGWEYTLPSKPNDRFGGYNENTFFMGYWFPQVSVFDDINGWDVFDYDAVAEFYNEYGEFDVKITVPENFIVWATGSLQNPGELLNKKYLARYNKAKKGKEVVQVIKEEDRKPGNDITVKGNNKWHFLAANVNDFAFGISSSYLWDASSIKTGSGKEVFVQAAYNMVNDNFNKVVEISCWSIKELEDSIIGIEFPYPSLTCFNGIGGMEYPMIVNDHDGTLAETIFVTTHEIAHTYFPFLVGINQRRHGWFDEGIITMLAMELHFLRDSTINLRKAYTGFYRVVSGTQMDIPQAVNSADLTDNIFQLHEYVRSSLGFWTLKDVMGPELFQKCLVEFIRRWEGKHPTPWDFYFTCNDISGKDYSWFFQPWFNGFAYADLSLISALYDNNLLEVKLENSGGMPFPSILKIIYEDGSSEEKFIQADQWSMSKQISIKMESSKKIESLVLDTSGYPDCNSENNILNL